MSLSTVSATVQDPSGQIFANGTWQLVFKPAYGAPGLFTDSGLPFNTLFGGLLDNTGSLSQAIARNDTIIPAGSKWTLIVSPNASGQAYSVDLTVNSGVFDASAAINAIITNILVPATAIAHAYKDSEVIPVPNSGAQYYDNVNKVLKLWDTALASWQTLTPTNGSPTFNNLFVTGTLTLNGNTSVNTFSIAGGEIWVPPGGSIQAAINSMTTGVVRLQPGIYTLGNTGITLKSGVQLIGANESSSIITYTGTGAAVLLDSTTEAAVRRIQIQIGNSATAIGLDVQNTTADSKFNTIENVQIQTTGGTFTAGQIGFRYMCSTAFALYWNTMFACQTVKLDTGFKLTNLGAFATNGCNDNKFFSLSAHFFTTGMVIEKFATENQIYGLTGSASGQLANNTLLIIGDGSVAANGNHIQGLVADTGAAGQSHVVKTAALNNYFVGVFDTAGRASTIAASTNTIINGYRNAATQANMFPNGSATNPPITNIASPTSGVFWSNGGQMEFSSFGVAIMEIDQSGPMLSNTFGYGWAGAADPNGIRTTNLGNPAAGVISADTTAVNNSLGRYKSSFAQLLEAAAPAGVAGSGVMWEDSSDHMWKYNPNNTGEQHVSQVLRLTAQYANSTTGFTTVGTPNFSFPVNANQTYTATFYLFYQATATGGLNIQFTGPGAPTSVIYGLNDPSAATTFNSAVATAFGTSLGQVVGTAATNFLAVVSFTLINGANAGTVTLQAKSSAAVQLQIQIGSYGIIQ